MTNYSNEILKIKTRMKSMQVNFLVLKFLTPKAFIQKLNEKFSKTNFLFILIYSLFYSPIQFNLFMNQI